MGWSARGAKSAKALEVSTKTSSTVWVSAVVTWTFWGCQENVTKLLQKVFFYFFTMFQRVFFHMLLTLFKSIMPFIC